MVTKCRGEWYLKHIVTVSLCCTNSVSHVNELSGKLTVYFMGGSIQFDIAGRIDVGRNPAQSKRDTVPFGIREYQRTSNILMGKSVIKDHDSGLLSQGTLGERSYGVGKLDHENVVCFDNCQLFSLFVVYDRGIFIALGSMATISDQSEAVNQSTFGLKSFLPLHKFGHRPFLFLLRLIPRPCMVSLVVANPNLLLLILSLFLLLLPVYLCLFALLTLSCQPW